MGRRTMGDSPDEGEREQRPARGPGPIEVLILAAWCGLAAGELEVAAQATRRLLSSSDRLYMMTRHFIWTVPTVNLFLFLALGAACALAARRWPRRGRWLGLRLVLFLAVLPTV